MPALVTVGLVTWNSAAHLDRCLRALACQTHPAIELVVIDNASVDDSRERVCRQFPEALQIQNTANYGFARAHNQAIQAGQGAYYLALNPDVILEPEYIAHLVAALEQHPGCGAAGGKLLLDNGLIDSTGLFIDRKRRQYLRGNNQADAGQFDIAGEVFGLDGAAPLFRRAMIEDVAEDGQFFDETFFSYKEDVDVAWRARLLGWKAWYTPLARGVHVRTFRPGQRERGSRETRRYSVRNRYLLLLKNEFGPAWRRDWPRIVLYDLAILAFILLRERASLAALADLRRVWSATARRRKDIMRRKRVADAACLDWFSPPPLVGNPRP